jgi:hypothetical protein
MGCTYSPRVGGAGVKSSDTGQMRRPPAHFALDELRRANQRPPPIDPNKLPALSYYDRHPEHRPRKLTRRQLRRRLIREA